MKVVESPFEKKRLLIAGRRHWRYFSKEQILYNLLELADKYATEASLYINPHNKHLLETCAEAALQCFDWLAYDKADLGGFDMEAFLLMKENLLNQKKPYQESKIMRYQLYLVAIECFEEYFLINKKN